MIIATEHSDDRVLTVMLIKRRDDFYLVYQDRHGLAAYTAISVANNDEARNLFAHAVEMANHGARHPAWRA